MRRSPSGTPKLPPYVPPAVTVIGTLEQITQGPEPDIGDTPTGVISF